jgi:DNA-binding CsgD family transcriptional regulator
MTFWKLCEKNMCCRGARAVGRKYNRLKNLFFGASLLGGVGLKQLLKVADKADKPYPMVRLAENEMAAILFTSGSTGIPKGVVYTQHIFSTQIKLLEKIFSTANKLNAANKTIRSLQGEVALAIDKQLAEWRLTPAEKEVAWLMVKGFSFKEIAGFRSVAEKTIHQQAANVYQKAGVGSRHELISGFLEDFVSPS